MTGTGVPQAWHATGCSRGGYISASDELTAHVEITSDVNDEVRSESSTADVEPDERTPIGVHLDVPLDPNQLI